MWSVTSVDVGMVRVWSVDVGMVTGCGCDQLVDVGVVTGCGCDQSVGVVSGCGYGQGVGVVSQGLHSLRASLVLVLTVLFRNLITK